MVLQMNSRELLVVFRKAHAMNLRDSLHSVKAAELLRRLITLEHRTLELDKKTVALMKKVLFNITSVYLFIYNSH
jgi:hypothetical protein